MSKKSKESSNSNKQSKRTKDSTTEFADKVAGAIGGSGLGWGSVDTDSTTNSNQSSTWGW